MGPRRAAGQHSVLPAENKGNGLQIWSASRASFAVTARHKSAGRIVTNRTAGASRAQIARCGTARGKLGASLAWQCPETPPATGEKDVGPRQAVGQQNVSTAENWDNGFRIGRAARASWDVAARRNSAGRIVTIGKTTHNVRCRTARSEHRAPRTRQRPATPLATGEQDVGPRLAAGQRGVLPAESHDNGLRLGRAARASLDAASRRKSAGRIVTNRKTGARRAQSARGGRTRGKLRASRARERRATPLVTGENVVGLRQAAGQQRVLAGRESRRRFAH